MTTPRDEHEAVMEALNEEAPEILNEAEGHVLQINDDMPEEFFFLNNNPFFGE